MKIEINNSKSHPGSFWVTLNNEPKQQYLAKSFRDAQKYVEIYLMNELEPEDPEKTIEEFAKTLFHVIHSDEHFSVPKLQEIDDLFMKVEVLYKINFKTK